MRRGWALWAAAAAACADPAPPVDPFAPDPISWPTDGAARALAAFSDDGAPAVALAYELAGEVRILRQDPAGALLAAGTVIVGGGPRAVASVGGALVTAQTGARTLTPLRRDGAWTAGAPAALDLPPTHLEPVDVGGGAPAVAVTVGTDGATGGVQLLRLAGDELVAAGPRLELPGVTETLAVDRDGDGDADLVAVLRLADRLVTLAGDGAGGFTLAADLPACDEPRAPAVSPLGLAVACAGGVLLVDAGVTLPWDGNLYDLHAADLNGDGAVDVAAVDLAAHAVVLWLGLPDGGFAPPALHPVSRGPIALAPVDAGGDGDTDLFVLAFEARALDLLVNDPSMKGDPP